ncbi:hypothetical protein HGRIS_004758 [Hohenbuehelia grisea]|uniref:Uncharacterized protein n=1 Tax=Hohenbuehelia grisea TaxID=104357 RepID=A0ABR3JCV9_9AGAR
MSPYSRLGQVEEGLLIVQRLVPTACDLKPATRDEDSTKTTISDIAAKRLTSSYVLPVAEDVNTADDSRPLVNIEVLLSDLQPSAIPRATAPSNAISLDTCPAFHALTTLSDALLMAPISMPVSPSISSGLSDMSTVAQTWRSTLHRVAERYADIAAWVDYFGSLCMHSSSSAAVRTNLFSTLGNFFTVTSSDRIRLGPLRHVVSATDHILFNLWLIQPDVPLFAPQSSLSKALAGALKLNSAADVPRWINAREKDTADRLLLIATQTPATQAIIDAVIIICKIGEKSTRIWNILLGRGLTSLLTTWFVDAAEKRPPVRAEAGPFLRLLSVLEEALRGCLSSSDGVFWAEEAMRTGILEGIYLITNWPAAMRFNVDLLAGDLIPYLRYLSVLRPAEKSIRRLEKGYNEEFGLPMDNTGVLRAVIRANTSAAKLAACWKNRCDFLGVCHTGLHVVFALSD